MPNVICHLRRIIIKMVDIGDDQENLSYLEWLIKDRLSKIKPSREYYSLKNILTAIKTKNKKMAKENIIGGLTKEEAVKLAEEFRKEKESEKTTKVEIRDSQGNLRMVFDSPFDPEMEFVNTAMAMDEGKNSEHWEYKEHKKFFEELREKRSNRRRSISPNLFSETWHEYLDELKKKANKGYLSNKTKQVLLLVEKGASIEYIAQKVEISVEGVRARKKMLQEDGHLPKIKRSHRRSYLIKLDNFRNNLTEKEADIYFAEKNLNVDMHKNDLLNKLKEDLNKKIKNNKTRVLTQVEIMDTLTDHVVDVK